jgi:hypothetical protein
VRDDRSPRWQPLRDLHREIARVVQVAPPRLLVCPELDAELVFLNLESDGRAALGLAVGRRLIAAGRADAVHTLARALAHARPAYILRALLPGPGTLDAALDAALMVGGFRGRVARTPAALGFAAAIDRRLPLEFRRHLAARAGALDGCAREELSMERWSEAVAATCRRTALLVCGELPVALAGLVREGAPTAQAAHQRRADLLVHSCSDDHAALRAALGLDLAVSAAWDAAAARAS